MTRVCARVLVSRRLARSMADLVAITSRLKAKGIALNILAMQLDTTTPTGKLMLQLMGCFAEFERDVMLERQREGVARAKAEGKYRGRRRGCSAPSAGSTA
jgi:DNA invertase Pin-like site-specific DNA recombinase